MSTISRVRLISLIKKVIVLMFALFRILKDYTKLFLLEVRIQHFTRPDEMPRRVELCREALKLVNRECDAKQWAWWNFQYASSLNNNPLGKRADNLENAICHYKRTLTVYTRQSAPRKWAMTINNLAKGYLYRIKGERADNLEEAIKHFKLALQVRTRQAAPEEWAMTINNLAIAYLDRIRGKQADNLEEAIKHLKQALQVRTRQAAPEEWAQSKNNLAIAYRKRIRGERADNLEQAIFHAKQALQVYTRQAAPREWAQTINNLAIVYLDRIKDERADNLEQAIVNFNNSLQVYTPQAAPREWAQIINNLAIAYLNRIKGERADNLELAIEYLKLALEVRTPHSFPQDCRDTAYGLGRLLYDEGRINSARKAFVVAYEAVEALRGETLREGARRKLAEENADLYACLVYCCLHDTKVDIEAAFEYAVTGKGRTFVDMLVGARFDLSAAGVDNANFKVDWEKYRELRQQIDNLLAYLSDESGLTRANLAKGSNTKKSVPKKRLRSQLQALQKQKTAHWEEMSFKYPKLTRTQKAPALSSKQACALAAELDATLVEYYRHSEGWCAFVVTSEEVRYVVLPDVTDDFVQNFVIEWLDQIENTRLQTIASYWTLDEWYESLISPLELPAEGKVVLAPAGVLHLIPLSIARHPESEVYLCDQYNVTFAPSLGALRVTLAQAQQKAEAKAEGSLLVAAYPSKPPRYLRAVIPEAEAIATHFPHVTPLHAEEATPQAVITHARKQNQEVVHFSCHAGFDPEQPQHSGFELFNGYLTVQRIITELRLSETRLTTLSACKTHRVALGGGEEHVGLVQSLMIAGAKSIVASLWSVEEKSTRALFEHFYQAIAKGEAPAIALKQAMQYVRQQTDEDGNKIWEHPFYWAAFQLSGLGF